MSASEVVAEIENFTAGRLYSSSIIYSTDTNSDTVDAKILFQLNPAWLPPDPDRVYTMDVSFPVVAPPRGVRHTLENMFLDFTVALRRLNM